LCSKQYQACLLLLFVITAIKQSAVFWKTKQNSKIEYLLEYNFKKWALLKSGLNQDNHIRKYAFLSITWVPAIRIEHVTAPSKVLSTRNVLCIEPMVICACGLHPNPVKVPNFQYRAWLCSIDQKFHGDNEKTRKSRFWDLGPRA
jgi:hypothetical protein